MGWFTDRIKATRASEDFETHLRFPGVEAGAANAAAKAMRGTFYLGFLVGIQGDPYAPPLTAFLEGAKGKMPADTPPDVLLAGLTKLSDVWMMGYTRGKAVR